MEKKTYYSNGKLLITGEYLVLHGALALAVPTILGQEMIVREGDAAARLSWQSFFGDECWFEAAFSLPGLEILNTTDKKKATYLSRLLLEAHRLNPKVLNTGYSLHIENRLGFHPTWGLGSSSSLINNMASWFDINPLALFFNTQKGSGYDMVCANAAGPVLYQLSEGKPEVKDVAFNPPFKDKLAFVYSGRKQDSEASISRFLNTTGFLEYEKGSISEISREIQKAESLIKFSELLDEHEEIMSAVLQMPKVKEYSFPDFPGSIKSLGAWGGDFLLAASENGFDEIKSYFSAVDLDVVFGFEELVLGAELI